VTAEKQYLGYRVIGTFVGQYDPAHLPLAHERMVDLRTRGIPFTFSGLVSAEPWNPKWELIECHRPNNTPDSGV
jgi:hypothetical protein